MYRPVRGTFEAALTSPLTPVDGVTVSVLQGRVPGLFVDNATDEVVTVTGAAGEPFVRIGPDGVEANLRSPTWVEALQAEGGAPAVAADADARPRWSRIAKVPRYGWKEYRALYPDDEPPEDVVRSGKPTPLREWTVPMTIGGETFEVTGVTTWQPLPPEPAALAAPAGQPSAPPQAGAPAPQPASPSQGRSPAGRLGAGAALVGVAAVAYLLARRRAA